MKRILLLSMPFGAMERPALGLSLLKARLTRDGIPCDVRYPSFTFADLLGPEEYQWVSAEIPYVAFAGDWCFAEALYGPRPAEDAAYIDEILRRTWRMGDAEVRRIQSVRSMAGRFLEHCMETIPWKKYAAVGFTSTFEQNLASLALAKRIKDRFPHVATVFGGANWEGEMGEELHRRFEFVDYACSGEADLTFPELAARLAAGTVEKMVMPPGIVYRREGATLSAGGSMPVRDMDSLPAPDYSDYFEQWSESSASTASVPILLVETSRGCWWGDKSHCTFCGLNGETMGFRSKSGDRAFAEMSELSDRWQTERIEIVDNILDMRHFADLLPALAADGRDWDLFYEVKANLTREQIAALRAAGVSRIQPGIESLSDRILKLMRKGTTGLRNVQLLKWCQEYGIGVDWNILYGFPGERPADYEEMLKQLPAIEFLHPPVACGPVRMDRFSPYFERPSEFGLSNVRPMPPYKYLYPFPRESLMRIAFHFDFDYPPGESPNGYTDGVVSFAEAWGQKPNRGMLSLVRGDGGSITLHDTRPGATIGSVELTGVEASVYEYCDELHSFGAVVRHVREQTRDAGIEEESVRGFLESLAANRLMLTDGKYWLSLAVRAPGIS